MNFPSLEGQEKNYSGPLGFNLGEIMVRTYKEKLEYARNHYYINRERNLLKRKYNITLEEYNKIFELQNGCCAICGKHQSSLRRSLCVDHNHSTGKIRGLLCDICNHGLGSFYDSINLLESAILYLKNKV